MRILAPAGRAVKPLLGLSAPVAPANGQLEPSVPPFSRGWVFKFTCGFASGSILLLWGATAMVLAELAAMAPAI